MHQPILLKHNMRIHSQGIHSWRASMVKLMHAGAGRELSSDAKLVKEARLGDSHVLLAMATPVQLDYTLPVSGSADSPAELVACQVRHMPPMQLALDFPASPTHVPLVRCACFPCSNHRIPLQAALAMRAGDPLCMQEGLYDILLRLADERSVPDVSLHAGSLLGMLPTWAEVRDAMVAAIADPAAAAQLGRILSPQADGSPAQGRHARLLYLLEVCLQPRSPSAVPGSPSIGMLPSHVPRLQVHLKLNRATVSN